MLWCARREDSNPDISLDDVLLVRQTPQADWCEDLKEWEELHFIYPLTRKPEKRHTADVDDEHHHRKLRSLL
jgi:hypothetical protein